MMDSMRSLNTSLPSSRSRRSQAPELLQAFKSAALSVTNLYKTAVTDQTNTRQLGYQDALEDLLSFLDKENLGLQDGEGWKVRQWATSRIEGTETAGNPPESDDDRGDTEKRARSSSTSSQARASHEEVGMHDHPNPQDTTTQTESTASAPRREESCPPDHPPIFTFSATHPFPSRDATMQVPETYVSNHQSSNGPLIEASASPSATPVRVEVLNRNTRMQNRNPSNRHHIRTSARDQGLVSGTKRKIYLPEFFDISNVGNSRDGLGGAGKRGRYM